MATLTVTLLPLVPLVLWLLTVAWSPTRLEGEPVLSVPIPLLARAKMVTLPFSAGVTVIAVIAIVTDARWISVVVLFIAFGLVLCIPIDYTLTTAGIRSGKGRFRRWTEFAGVRRFTTGAILQGGPRSASYPIYLSGNRDDDEFVLALKNLVLDSYKGTGVVKDRLRRDKRPR